MGSRLQVTIAIMGMVAARSASADDVLIENKPSDRAASTGFLAEGGLGAVAFLPSVNKDAGVGPELELRIGRDLQYVRVNGTLVGFLAGGVVYALLRATFGAVAF